MMRRTSHSAWTWRVFDDRCTCDGTNCPTHGWARSWEEETENGVVYEVREWVFTPSHPDQLMVIGVTPITGRPKNVA